MPDHYDPNRPRDPEGRWSETGSASSQGTVVKHLAPEVGQAKHWEEGPPILGYGNPPLERGTAIATFTGRQYANAVTGNHAAIFLDYGMKDGRQGIWVLDQSAKLKPEQRFKYFGKSAEHYSVIKRK